MEVWSKSHDKVKFTTRMRGNTREIRNFIMFPQDTAYSQASYFKSSYRRINFVLLANSSPQAKVSAFSLCKALPPNLISGCGCSHFLLVSNSWSYSHILQLTKIRFDMYFQYNRCNLFKNHNCLW